MSTEKQDSELAASPTSSSPTTPPTGSVSLRPTKREARLPESHDGATVVEEKKLSIAEAEAGDGVATEDAAKPITKGKMAIIVLALALSLFCASLDISIISTILPTIAEEFDSGSGYVWIGSSYTLGCTVSSPLWAKFSDIWGRKPILLACSFVFFLGSLLCGVSKSSAMILAGRSVQGLGTGGLLVLPIICISDMVSMRDRSAYYALLSSVWAVAGATGPVVGGAFAEHSTWRWSFYMNLPIVAVSVVVLIFFLDIHNPRTPILAGLKAVDWLGCLALTAATILFLVGLEMGGVHYAWDSALVVCLLVFGIVCGVLFGLIQAYVAPYPLLPARLVNKLSAVPILVFVWMHGMIMIAAQYYLPIFFQAVYGASPTTSGLWMLPQAVSIALSGVVSGIIVKKTGKYRSLVRVAFAITVLGCGLLINLGPNRSIAKIILYQIVLGIGIGPLFQGGLISMQATAAAGDIASATAVVQLDRNVSTSVSIVVAGVMIQNFLIKKSSGILNEVLGAEGAKLYLSGNLGAITNQIARLPAPQRDVVRNEVSKSISLTWVVFTAFAAVGLISSFFLRGEELNATHVERKTGLQTLATRKGDELKECDSKLASNVGLKEDLETGSGRG